VEAIWADIRLPIAYAASAAEGAQLIGDQELTARVGIEVAEHEERILGERAGYRRRSRNAGRSNGHMAAQAVALVEERPEAIRCVDTIGSKNLQAVVYGAHLVTAQVRICEDRRIKRRANVERF